jgi:hypothetical protein
MADDKPGYDSWQSREFGNLGSYRPGSEIQKILQNPAKTTRSRSNNSSSFGVGNIVGGAFKLIGWLVLIAIVLFLIATIVMIAIKIIGWAWR